mgnify:FL=1
MVGEDEGDVQGVVEEKSDNEEVEGEGAFAYLPERVLDVQ